MHDDGGICPRESNRHAIVPANSLVAKQSPLSSRQKVNFVKETRAAQLRNTRCRRLLLFSMVGFTEMEMQGSISALDDSSIAEILARVDDGDAREIAKCRCVCKQWQRVAWAVPRLVFYFDDCNLRDKEAIISSVLQRTNTEAPGCLKMLTVSLHTPRFHGYEATGQWLVYVADSVVELELHLQDSFDDCSSEGLLWGPTVSSYLSRFHALQRFSLSGHLFSVANESPFKTLMSCTVWEAATLEFLQALCAACPMLTDLSVHKFGDLDRSRTSLVTLRSASLERFLLCPPPCPPFGEGVAGVIVRLHTPCLKSLDIKHEAVDLYTTSLENLLELKLGGPCVLHGAMRLKHLYVWGWWDSVALGNLLQLTPMVSDLKLGLRFKDAPVCGFFAPLRNLEKVTLYMDDLECFKLDDIKELAYETVTVQVELFSRHDLRTPRHLNVLRHFLVVWRVRLVVLLYCGEDYSLAPRRLSRRLKHMMKSFPGRIVFKARPFARGDCSLCFHP